MGAYFRVWARPRKSSATPITAMPKALLPIRSQLSDYAPLVVDWK